MARVNYSAIATKTIKSSASSMMVPLAFEVVIPKRETESPATMIAPDALLLAGAHRLMEYPVNSWRTGGSGICSCRNGLRLVEPPPPGIDVCGMVPLAVDVATP